MSDRPTRELRNAVALRAGYRCEYCGTQAIYSSDSLSVEHIVPRIAGGMTTEDNLALACQGCNNRKFTRVDGTDPITGDVVPLYHPRQHVWSEHFAWSSDRITVLGVTPVGRATVERLQLNRPGVVNLRRVLREIQSTENASSDLDSNP